MTYRPDLTFPYVKESLKRQQSITALGNIPPLGEFGLVEDAQLHVMAKDQLRRLN